MAPASKGALLNIHYYLLSRQAKTNKNHLQPWSLGVKHPSQITADTQLSLKITRLKPLYVGWLFHDFDFATRLTYVLKQSWKKQDC